MVMPNDIQAYHDQLQATDQAICNRLYQLIDQALPEAEKKLWHAHPVWFLDGNPIVGYAKRKDAVRLLFWSGQSFEVDGLTPEGSFKAAEARYDDVMQIDDRLLASWLAAARRIQWDYKNIVKNKGRLDRLEQ